MSIVKLQSVTGEQVFFRFDYNSQTDWRGTAGVELNCVPMNIQYRGFSVTSYETTGIIDVFVVIPEGRQIPNKIIVTLENRNDNPSYPMKEYREFVIMYHKDNAFATKTWSLAMSCLLSGRPHQSVASEQTVEFILDYGSHREPLICPVNGTGRFNICLSAAHEAQQYDKQDLPEILNEIIKEMQ